MSKPWEHSSGPEWEKEAEAYASRTKKARKMLRILGEKKVWVFLNDHGKAALVGLDENLEKLTKLDMKRLYECRRELAELIPDRRLDGVADSRLLFFFEDVSFYHTPTEQRYFFPKFSFRVVREDLAERLVHMGGACYHPGPE